MLTQEQLPRIYTLMHVTCIKANGYICDDVYQMIQLTCISIHSEIYVDARTFAMDIHADACHVYQGIRKYTQ